MKKKIFLLVVIGVLLFTFGAFANDNEFVAGFGYEDDSETQDPVTMLEMPEIPDYLKKILSTPKDVVDEPVLPQQPVTRAANNLSKDVIAYNGEKVDPQPYPYQLLVGVDSLLRRPMAGNNKFNEKLLDIEDLAEAEGRPEATETRENTETSRLRNSVGNTNPNAALTMTVNRAYAQTLSGTGDQAWYAVQPASAGQLTFHVEVAHLPVDYDLYIYKYDFATGYLNPHASSVNDPYRDEHTSISVQAGDIYFFLVTSYSGGSATPFTMFVGHNTSYFNNEIDDVPANYNAMSANSRAGSFIQNICDQDYYRFTVTDNTTVVSLLAGNQHIAARLYDASLNPLSPSGYIVSNENEVSTMIKPDNDYVIPLSPGTYYLKVTPANKTTLPGTIQYYIYVNNFNCNESIGNVLTRTLDGSRIAYRTNSDGFWVNSKKISTGISRAVTITRTGNVYANGVNLQAEYEMRANDLTGSIPLASFVRYNSGLVSVPDAFAVYSASARLSNTLRLRRLTTDNWTSTNVAEELNGWFIINLQTGETVDCYSNGNGYYNGAWSPYLLYTASLTEY